MKLHDYVDIYVLEHDLQPTTIQQYKCSVSSFERWHGAPIDVETELTTTLVNQYLQFMKATGKSDYTRKSRRSNLVTLWLAMVDNPDIAFNRDHSRILRVRCGHLDVDCFTKEQVEQLIAHCSQLKGRLRGTRIPKSIYWESFTRAGWDSGLRLGDLLKFTRTTVADIVERKGVIRIHQSKVRRYVDCYFHPSTVKAMQLCLQADPREKVWPLWARREQFFDGFRNLVRAAGLDGTTKYLRRGAATDAEIVKPGSAAKKLGHSPSSQGLAERFYIDHRILPANPVITRELQSPEEGSGDACGSKGVPMSGAPVFILEGRFW